MPTTTFAKSLSIERCRVESTPSFVFLCGGKLNPDLTSVFVESARASFFRQLSTNCQLTFPNHIVVAEDVFRRFPEADYKDLLSFEQDLAELSSLILIFVESPGSFAELGSFVALPNVRRRVAVVIADEFANNESFIWKGPIANMKNNNLEKRIHVYPWDAGSGPCVAEKFFAHTEDLSESIESIIQENIGSHQFDVLSTMHQMLLMLEFARLSQIVLISDVVEFFNNLDFPEESRKSEIISRRLALLSSLGLIEEKLYGHNKYFISKSDKKWMSFSYKKDSPISDENRWKAVFAKHRLEDKKNHRKVLALRAWTKSSTLAAP